MIHAFRRFNVAVRPASSRFACQISTEQDQDTTSSIAGSSRDKSCLTQHRWFSSSNSARDSERNPDSNSTSVIGAVKQRRGEAVKTLSVTGGCLKQWHCHSMACFRGCDHRACCTGRMIMSEIKLLPPGEKMAHLRWQCSAISFAHGVQSSRYDETTLIWWIASCQSIVMEITGLNKQSLHRSVYVCFLAGSSQTSSYVLQSSKVTFGWAAASRSDGKPAGSMSLLGFASAYFRHTTRWEGGFERPMHIPKTSEGTRHRHAPLLSQQALESWHVALHTAITMCQACEEHLLSVGLQRGHTLGLQRT